MPNAIMHFEIPADDVERAKTFYKKVFGWKFESYPASPGEDEYFMVMAKDGENGINGGLMKRKMPGQPFANYVTVDSIDQMLSAANASGARTALPKQEIGGGMGWIAAFLDPENNLIGLHQIGPNAQRPAAAKKAPVAKAAPAAPAAKRAPVAKKSGRKTVKAAAKKPAKRAKKSGRKRR
jgi:predicted enzyme related to lactoylglutathione lyase